MAKKVNSLADDFAGINKAADNNVLSILTEEKQKQAKGNQAARQSPKQVASKANPESHAENSKTSQPKKTKQLRKTKDWGKPVANLNTRIPERMSELLDDLIYRLRKKGTPKTKQELAHEAIYDLLCKHSIF